MKKKIDSRIRTLIENGINANHRTFFVVVGDKGRDQVVNLHYMLTKAAVRARPSILWCYKKELGFSSHRQKRMKQIKKMIQRGLHDPNKDDPFELFISSTDIRYCYYKDTQKILGNTFGMCILQDFEAITPNLLARTIETVEGGGVIVLLLRTMNSLQQLYTMTMDVHNRFRTEAHHEVVARFNERFLLSLAQCENCLVVDEELNILPISSKAKNILPLPPKDPSAPFSQTEEELKELKKSLEDTQPVGTLIKNTKTLDQGKALLTLIEAISEKTLRTTVALTAGRGRGKSACLGLAISSAVAYGYSNIFVTSPSPENLKTLFEFIFKGFDALGYEEHLDYDIVQSTNPDFNKAVIRVNIFREHRQTIQYIDPSDSHVLGQAELVVIDEAAAIPLPKVKALLGPYLVFLSSTVNGYEGTGRSLSLKLIQQLRETSIGMSSTKVTEVNAKSATGRALRELKLDEPIRYSLGDPIETWLNQLLCLDATLAPKSSTTCPHPSECELYYVNRDTLFSFHKAAESFLQKVVSIYVSSHYKNSPNDLQLLSDAPAHHIFVLLGPVDEKSNAIPEVLAVIQIAFEGEISRNSILAGLSRGERASGDLIPWTISQQFQDENFGSLSGGRVVRIATHPDYQKMGYGSRCLELLKNYYEGKVINLQENEETTPKTTKNEEVAGLNEELKPRKNLPPLLMKLTERKHEHLDYLGVSFGLTDNLHRFWKKAGYVPVYLRQTPNELTGEHTCIMLHALNPDSSTAIIQVLPEWLDLFWSDFQKRFLSLLSYQFRNFSTLVALDILNNKAGSKSSTSIKKISKEELFNCFSAYDLKRIDSYARNMVDYHLILDLVPTISDHYFSKRFADEVSLSPVQQAILAGLGLQRKLIEEVEKELSITSSQVLALFNKTIRKFSQQYQKIQEKAIDYEIEETKQVEEGGDRNVLKRKLNTTDEQEWDPLEKTLDQDLEEAGNEFQQKFKEQQKKMLESLDLQQYAIAGGDKEWKEAIKGDSIPTSISIPNPQSTKAKKLKSYTPKENTPKNDKEKKSKFKSKSNK